MKRRSCPVRWSPRLSAPELVALDTLHDPGTKDFTSADSAIWPARR